MSFGEFIGLAAAAAAQNQATRTRRSDAAAFADEQRGLWHGADIRSQIGLRGSQAGYYDQNVLRDKTMLPLDVTAKGLANSQAQVNLDSSKLGLLQATRADPLHEKSVNGMLSMSDDDLASAALGRPVTNPAAAPVTSDPRLGTTIGGIAPGAVTNVPQAAAPGVVTRKPTTTPDLASQAVTKDSISPYTGKAYGANRGLTRVVDPTGGGSPMKDTVPFELAENEAVLNAGAAEILGRDKIAALNKQGLRVLGKSEASQPVVKGGRVHAASGTERVGDPIDEAYRKLVAARAVEETNAARAADRRIADAIAEADQRRATNPEGGARWRQQPAPETPAPRGVPAGQNVVPRSTTGWAPPIIETFPDAPPSGTSGEGVRWRQTPPIPAGQNVVPVGQPKSGYVPNWGPPLNEYVPTRGEALEQAGREAGIRFKKALPAIKEGVKTAGRGALERLPVLGDAAVYALDSEERKTGFYDDPNVSNLDKLNQIGRDALHMGLRGAGGITGAAFGSVAASPFLGGVAGGAGGYALGGLTAGAIADKESEAYKAWKESRKPKAPEPKDTSEQDALAADWNKRRIIQAKADREALLKQRYEADKKEGGFRANLALMDMGQIGGNAGARNTFNKLQERDMELGKMQMQMRAKQGEMFEKLMEDYGKSFYLDKNGDQKDDKIANDITRTIVSQMIAETGQFPSRKQIAEAKAMGQATANAQRLDPTQFSGNSSLKFAVGANGKPLAETKASWVDALTPWNHGVTMGDALWERPVYQMEGMDRIQPMSIRELGQGNLDVARGVRGLHRAQGGQ